jgi:hypothetical protein
VIPNEAGRWALQMDEPIERHVHEEGICDRRQKLLLTECHRPGKWSPALALATFMSELMYTYSFEKF